MATVEKLVQEADRLAVENPQWSLHTLLKDIVASLAKQDADLRRVQSQDPAGKPGKQEKLGDPPTELNELKKQLKEQAIQLEQLGDQQTELSELKKQLKEQATKLEKLEAQQKVIQVAFSGVLSAEIPIGTEPEEEIILKGEQIRFITNTGNAFHPETGIFTAPVKGVYHFHWSFATSANDARAGATLVKNSVEILDAYEKQEYGYVSSSEGVTLILEERDNVFLRLDHSSKALEVQWCNSTFSGHLLFTM